MGRKLRRGGLAAAACLVVTVAAACSSASSSSSASSGSASPAASGAHGTLIVFGAGTLATPFTAEIAAFKQANPGVTVHSEFSASGDRVKAITQLHQPADVLGVADYSLIPKLMFTANATWYLGFVSNQITFAYTSHSKGASQLTPANWYKVLAQPGVRIGRSNPAADPSGYQTLQMLQLANGYYHQPNLSASVLKNSPDSSVAETETSLLAALQSGQIDYLAIYKSTAQEQHLKYIALPPQINLSDPALAADYGKVSIHAGSLGTLTAKPIIYGLTIPTSAPNAALGQKFVSFVLSSAGQAIMRSNGFVVISPALANPQAKIPASLQSLTTQWPAATG
ncbi:MAG TPA: extracellular solute-binding protein [Streptosporangiaceae bacterium]